MIMITPGFEIGRTVHTPLISNRMSEDTKFHIFIATCINRYLCYEWGKISDEEKKQNKYAVENGERIFAAYEYPKTKEMIYIITEADRSATTIMFASEY